MNSKDLRLGNLISYMDANCICMVREIFEKKISVNVISQCSVYPTNPVHEANIGGIEITGDWLILLGFEKVNGTWETYYLPGVYVTKESDGFYLRSGNVYINRTPFSFVHEIQNLYQTIRRKDIVIDEGKIQVALLDGKMEL